MQQDLVKALAISRTQITLNQALKIFTALIQEHAARSTSGGSVFAVIGAQQQAPSNNNLA